MKKFVDIFKDVSLKTPQHKPEYPSINEIKNADIKQIVFWLVHLPIIEYEDPDIEEKMERVALITYRAYKFRVEEGSWKGAPLEIVGGKLSPIKNERKVDHAH